MNLEKVTFGGLAAVKSTLLEEANPAKAAYKIPSLIQLVIVNHSTNNHTSP